MSPGAMRVYVRACVRVCRSVFSTHTHTHTLHTDIQHAASALGAHARFNGKDWKVQQLRARCDSNIACAQCGWWGGVAAVRTPPATLPQGTFHSTKSVTNAGQIGRRSPNCKKKKNCSIACAFCEARVFRLSVCSQLDHKLGAVRSFWVNTNLYVSGNTVYFGGAFERTDIVCRLLLHWLNGFCCVCCLWGCIAIGAPPTISARSACAKQQGICRGLCGISCTQPFRGRERREQQEEQKPRTPTHGRGGTRQIQQ